VLSAPGNGTSRWDDDQRDSTAKLLEERWAATVKTRFEGKRSQTKAGGRRLLRHLARDLREHVVGIAADQSDCANDNHQDHCQHHRIFGDILTLILTPKLTDS